MKHEVVTFAKRSLVAAALALCAAAPSYATTIDTNGGGAGDGILTNFIGFDWHSDGQALISGFDLTTANTTGNSDLFSLDYHGFTKAIFATGATPNLQIPAINGGVPGTYEITLVAHLDEQAVCLVPGCSALNLNTLGGSFTVYADYSPNADPVAGTGYADAGSIAILQGSFTGGFAIYSGTPSPGGNGTGGGSVFATVTYSNPLFFNPSLLSAGATTQTSLQFGAFQTADYHRSTCFELGGATGITGGPCTNPGPDSPTSFEVQADTSTTLAVPEPATLALLGIGLLGLGVTARKRKS